jgi:hypothetical protein
MNNKKIKQIFSVSKVYKKIKNYKIIKLKI